MFRPIATLVCIVIVVVCVVLGGIFYLRYWWVTPIILVTCLVAMVGALHFSGHFETLKVEYKSKDLDSSARMLAELLRSAESEVYILSARLRSDLYSDSRVVAALRHAVAEFGVRVRILTGPDHDSLNDSLDQLLQERLRADEAVLAVLPYTPEHAFVVVDRRHLWMTEENEMLGRVSYDDPLAARDFLEAFDSLRAKLAKASTTA